MERLGLAAVALVAIVVAIRLAAWWLERSRRRTVARLQAAPVADNPAGPRILYFTTPQCAECRVLQKPALRQLEERFGPALAIETVDAIEQPALARRYRVRTVPTTAVFDRSGRLVDVNYGYAPADHLARQLLGQPS